MNKLSPITYNYRARTHPKELVYFHQTVINFSLSVLERGRKSEKHEWGEAVVPTVLLCLEALHHSTKLYCSESLCLSRDFYADTVFYHLKF